MYVNDVLESLLEYNEESWNSLTDIERRTLQSEIETSSKRIIYKYIKQPSFVNGIFIATLLISALTQFVFGLGSNFTLALISSLIWGVCLGAISLIPFSLLLNLSRENNKGSLIGFGSSASKLGNLMGVALGAGIQAETNFTYSFFAIAILYCMLAGLLWIVQLRSRSQIKLVEVSL